MYIYIAAAYLTPVIAIHGQFQAAEEYLSKAAKCLSNVGQFAGGIFKTFPPVIAALCGKTAGAQRLVQQSLKIDSRDLQKKIDGKFSTYWYSHRGQVGTVEQA